MNEVTKFKYWLAGSFIFLALVILSAVVFLTNMSGEIKASIITFLITTGTLVMQYYFRKAGSNEAEPDIPENTDESPKAISPIGGVGVTQGWGRCTTCNTDGTTSSEPNIMFEEVTPTDTPPNHGDMNWETARNAVINQTLNSGVKADEASVSANLVSWWANHQDEVSPVAKKGVLDWGIELAQKAFTKVTGLNAPTSFAAVADYNKYWRENSVGCLVNKATARPLFMTLRDLLRIRESL